MAETNFKDVALAIRDAIMQVLNLPTRGNKTDWPERYEAAFTALGEGVVTLAEVKADLDPVTGLVKDELLPAQLTKEEVWDASVFYKAGRRVFLNNAIFEALQDNQGQSPSVAVPPVATINWKVVWYVEGGGGLDSTGTTETVVATAHRTTAFAAYSSYDDITYDVIDTGGTLLVNNSTGSVFTADVTSQFKFEVSVPWEALQVGDVIKAALFVQGSADPNPVLRSEIENITVQAAGNYTSAKTVIAQLTAGDKALIYVSSNPGRNITGGANFNLKITKITPTGQTLEERVDAAVTNANTAADQAYSAAADTAQYVSETTADPPLGPEGAIGSKRLVDGSLQRLVVVGGVWVNSGPALLSTQSQHVITAARFGFASTGTAAQNDSAITNALAAVASGGVVDFPPGVFTVSAVQTITKPVTLRGNGTRLVADSEANHKRFDVQTNDVTIEGFTLDGAYVSATRGFVGGVITVQGTSSRTVIRGNRIRNARGIGVYVLAGVRDTKITHNTIEGTYHGVFQEPTAVDAVPIGTLIQGNTIRDVRGLDVCGIKLKGGLAKGGRHRIIGNDVRGVTALGDSGGGLQLGIELQGGAATAVGQDECAISSNTVEGFGWGISVDGSHGASVSGNTVRGCLLLGLEVAGAMRVSVTGNSVNGRDASGTLVMDVGISMSNLYNGARTQGHSVTGNTVDGFTEAGIKMQQSEHWVVAGNTIKHGPVGGNGINPIKSDYFTILGNTIEGQSDTAVGLFLDGVESINAASIIGNNFSGTLQKPFDLYTSATGQTIQNVTVTGNSLKATLSTGFTLTGPGTFAKISLVGNVGSASMEGHWVDYVQRVGVLEGTFPPNNNQTSGEGSIYLDNFNAGEGRLWVKVTGGIGNTGWVNVRQVANTTTFGLVKQAAAMADVAAAPTQAEFNALLQRLRNAGLMAT